jgi:hypothetical protein
MDSGRIIAGLFGCNTMKFFYRDKRTWTWLRSGTACMGDDAKNSPQRTREADVLQSKVFNFRLEVDFVDANCQNAHCRLFSLSYFSGEKTLNSRVVLAT